MTIKKTLLEKAIEFKGMRKTRTEVLPECEDLAIAVLKGEITHRQAGAALYEDPKRSGNTYTTLFIALRSAHKRGRIKFL